MLRLQPAGHSRIANSRALAELRLAHGYIDMIKDLTARAVLDLEGGLRWNVS